VQKILPELYKRFSGKYAMPGAPKYVSLDEFMDMIQMSGIVDEDFG